MTDEVLHKMPPKPHGGCVRPFPFGPLERAVGAPCAAVAARELGIAYRQLYRWRKSGLTVEQADVLAFRIGLHPCEVWGNDWWAAPSG